MAKDFYVGVLGLKLVEASMFSLLFEDGGHNLRVQIVDDLGPPAYTAHGWRVDDIEAEVTDLASKAVKFLRFDDLTQDRYGIWTSPSGAKIVWFNDPSGNILSLTENPKD